jgi:hypothetical protein
MECPTVTVQPNCLRTTQIRNRPINQPKTQLKGAEMKFWKIIPFAAALAVAQANTPLDTHNYRPNPTPTPQDKPTLTPLYRVTVVQGSEY